MVEVTREQEVEVAGLVLEVDPLQGQEELAMETQDRGVCRAKETRPIGAILSKIRQGMMT